MKRYITFLFCTVLSAALCTSAAALSPNTGDTSNVPLWIGMAAAAVVLVIVVLVMLKKRK